MKKKVFLLIIMATLLTACSKNDPSSSMENMPCHEMGGSYMGDCKFDENGNVIPPQEETMDMNEKNGGENFSEEITNLPEAKPSEVVELKDGETYSMTASYVKQEIGNQVMRRLAYNGQIPGPLLKVEKNAEIKLVFKNDLDIETTIHSHGLRLDNAFDGTPDLTQKPIKPGESFTYTLKFPDEGVYWYHPHIREDYAQEMGLYGNFLVKPKEENYWNPVNKEEFLMLDDILVNEDQPTFNKDMTDHALMGRFGNTTLINNEEYFNLKAKKGEVIRFYLTNVANTRTFNFQIPGAKLKLVGGDSGRIEKEVYVDSVVIAPAERYIVEAYFPQEGQFEIQNQTPDKSYDMGEIVVEGNIDKNLSQFFLTPRSNNDYKNFRSAINEWLKKAEDKSIKLSIEMKGMAMDMMDPVEKSDGIEWEENMQMMNAIATSGNTKWKIIDEKTGKENMDIDWKFKKGELVKIKIYNDPNSPHPMQHPIHFHGQRFLILSRNGVTNQNFQWKDTALVKTGETVEILVEMSNPGRWMGHCHIAEHLETGMMFEFEVEN